MNTCPFEYALLNGKRYICVRLWIRHMMFFGNLYNTYTSRECHPSYNRRIRDYTTVRRYLKVLPSNPVEESDNQPKNSRNRDNDLKWVRIFFQNFFESDQIIIKYFVQ